MATAAVYDGYEDAGMAFTDEAVASYSVEGAATERLTELLTSLAIIKRRTRIPDAPKPEWLETVLRLMVPSVTWMIQVAGLEGRDPEELLELPGPKTESGKALTVLAQRMEPEAWLGEMEASVDACIRLHVTLSRRAIGTTKWSKAQRSASNKYANALMGQRRQIAKCREALNRKVKSKKEVDDAGAE